jgi:hypothetical protein
MFQLQKYLPGENKNEYDLERADPISYGQHILWALLFLSGSLLTGFFIAFLCKASLKKIKSSFNEKLLNNNHAVALFKKIETEGNHLENDPLWESGLAGKIDIKNVAKEIEIDESAARDYIQKFTRFGWLKFDCEGNIYGLSDYGRDVKFRLKIK